jgi:short-subunit dehydrogenase
MRLANARMVLTGASGGIGAAIVRALRPHGVQVMGVSRSGQPSDTEPDLKHKVTTWVAADLTQAAGVQALAQAATDWGANLLVHAAGAPAFGPLTQVQPEEASAVLQTNLWAPIVLTQALLPHLLSLSEARVLFVGSALGRIGVPGYSLYGASKAGLHGFAEALRRELLGTSVKVQLLAPRTTRTAFNDAASQRFNQATGSATDSADHVAQQLLALLQSGAAERFVGSPEKWLVRLNGAYGPLLDAGFRRHREMLPSLHTQGSTT